MLEKRTEMGLVLLILLSVILVNTEVKAQNCESGWFGENCMNQCHCYQNESCDIQGRCSNGCGNFYIGPGCQYVDLVPTNADFNTQSFVKDYNPWTCNPNNHATEVDVFLSKSFRQAWMSVYATTIKDFRVVFNTIVPCQNERKFIKNSFVYVFCENDIPIRRITVSGPIAPFVCSVHLTSGRNTAIRQKANASSSYGYLYHARFAVDGRPGIDGLEADCYRSQGYYDSWWTLKLNRPVTIYYIEIYNRGIWLHQLSGFRIEAYTPSGETAFFWYDLAPPLAVYIVPFTTTVPIGSIKIFGNDNKHPDDRHLTLCEVKVYSEVVCPDGTYGLWCENDCQCNSTTRCGPTFDSCVSKCSAGYSGIRCSVPCNIGCLGGSCSANLGKCFGCKIGYFGEYCQACINGFYGDVCSGTCSAGCEDVCDHITGNCLCKPNFKGHNCNECLGGMSGANCTVKCPDGCSAEGCDIITGVCKACKYTNVVPGMCNECVAGFYGESCETSCSGDCSSEGCNKTTGACEYCKHDNQVGELCEECINTFYGSSCDLDCPEFCLNGTCYKYTGECYACMEGYSGLKCEIITDEFNVALFLHAARQLIFIICFVVLAIVLAVFGIVFLLKERIDNDAAEEF